MYRAVAGEGYRAHNLDILTTNSAGFRHIEVIEDRTLFRSLGLPLTLGPGSGQTPSPVSSGREGTR